MFDLNKALEKGRTLLPVPGCPKTRLIPFPFTDERTVIGIRETSTLDGMTALPPPTAVCEIARWVLDEAIEAETHGRRQIAEATRR
jgi:hypothetical protein